MCENDDLSGYNVTVTGTRWTALFAYPPRFHCGSSGCTFPASSRARQQSSYSPGSAFHENRQPRQAQRPPTRSATSASDQVVAAMTQVSSVSEQQASLQRERANTLASLEQLADGLRTSISTFHTR